MVVKKRIGSLFFYFRIFDDDDDGCIHAGDLVEVLTNLGEKLTKSEARKLVQKALFTKLKYSRWPDGPELIIIQLILAGAAAWPGLAELADMGYPP